ncbi:toll/interleukin-1 receptor domain-containing protein [Pseudomonas aeruginosa]
MNTREVRFDIALSFAGEDRVYVDRVANLLRDSGVKVFYDLFEEANLWGKNLYEYLTQIYQEQAKFTIMFISEAYAQKLWTNHERKVMQARAFQEAEEYILPARFDETPIPGVLPTIGYISLRERTPEDFVEVIHRKLVGSGGTVPSALLRRELFSTRPVGKAVSQQSIVTIREHGGAPISGASVVAIADNHTTKSASTVADGTATLSINTRRLYRLMIAHPDYPAAFIDSWDPGQDITVDLSKTPGVGSVIFNSTGHIPGLQGRLNPILDTSDRTYLYADNIAIEGGQAQPATFRVGVPFELEDSDGVVMYVRILHIEGRTSLIQYAKGTIDD